jgi:hypothetical protein
MTFTEYSYWSPVLGDDAVRLSVFNDRGGELYIIIPDGSGYVDRRAAALELLAEALEERLPPGEVRVRPPA